MEEERAMPRWPLKPDCVLSAPTEELILIPVGVKMLLGHHWKTLSPGEVGFVHVVMETMTVPDRLGHVKK